MLNALEVLTKSFYKGFNLGVVSFVIVITALMALDILADRPFNSTIIALVQQIK